MIDMIPFVLLYFAIGMLIYCLGAGAFLPTESRIIAGFMIFYPLYIVKWIVILIGAIVIGIAAFIKSNISKWFIIPYNIVMVPFDTFRHLLGIKKFKRTMYNDISGELVKDDYV